MSLILIADIALSDRTRITLGPPCDYIHASRVCGPPLQNVFIATQAPLPNTCDDFWRMCLQERPAFVFMLCDFQEDGRDKCAGYYPTQKAVPQKWGGECFFAYFVCCCLVR